MIEVIGQDEGAAKQVTCKNCGAILKYYEVDVKIYSGTDYSGGPDGRHWIVCPKCKDSVTLKAW